MLYSDEAFSIKKMTFQLLAPGETISGWQQGINAIYVSNKWSSGLSDEKISQIFGRSEFILSAHENRVVGFVRGFTDHYITTHLTEIAVHTDLHRKGVGRSLLDAFCNAYAHTAIYTESLAGTADFFAKGPMLYKKTLIPFSRKAIKPNDQ